MPAPAPGVPLQDARSAPARVLRNTYALLSVTLLFSAAVAAASAALALPAPGLVMTLVGLIGLLLAVHKLRNSAWALLAVAASAGELDDDADAATSSPRCSRAGQVPVWFRRWWR